MDVDLSQILEKIEKHTPNISKRVINPSNLLLEPFGEASFTMVMDNFKKQLSDISEKSEEDLVFITQPLSYEEEARICAITLAKYKKPIVMIIELNEEGETLDDSHIIPTLVILQELGVSALGISGKCDFKEVLSQMENYAKIPIFSIYDCKPFKSDNMEYYERKSDIILANKNEVFKLHCDQIECSNPLECYVDMADELLELEDSPIDVVVIEINCPEDAYNFAENQYLINKPVCFYSHDELSLKLALMLYNGIAMIDQNSSIDENILDEITKKYGALIY